MPNLIELRGRRFVRLKVLERAERTVKSGRLSWRCRCDCGNEVIVDGGDLRSGKTMSCGCILTRPLDGHEKLLRSDLALMRARRKEHASRPVKKPKVRPLKRRNLTGRLFGLLTVRRFDHRDQYRKDYWLCFCGCGRKRIVRADKLISGRHTSCGCKGCKRTA